MTYDIFTWIELCDKKWWRRCNGMCRPEASVPDWGGIKTDAQNAGDSFNQWEIFITAVVVEIVHVDRVHHSSAQFLGPNEFRLAAY